MRICFLRFIIWQVDKFLSPAKRLNMSYAPKLETQPDRIIGVQNDKYFSAGPNLRRSPGRTVSAPEIFSIEVRFFLDGLVIVLTGVRCVVVKAVTVKVSAVSANDVLPLL